MLADAGARETAPTGRHVASAGVLRYSATSRGYCDYLGFIRTRTCDMLQQRKYELDADTAGLTNVSCTTKGETSMRADKRTSGQAGKQASRRRRARNVFVDGPDRMWESKRA